MRNANTTLESRSFLFYFHPHTVLKEIR